ncbi:MAG: DUF1592 domain-containing protein [Bryobacterales bacterium]|nr:DUF1592 domain-containing protein [Bryobacterales bacterium]MDE0296972.1 DUF1592 domain-containing protein [Bryobacterales bacterium]MDE0433954.1 DUF1592 domain-containing protein [Bryobacterales bacterium]
MKQIAPNVCFRRLLSFTAAGALLLSLGTQLLLADQPPEIPSIEKARFEQHVRPLFETNCYACHASAVKVAGFDLERLLAEYPDSLVRDFRRWETVAEQVVTRSMPPAGHVVHPSAERRRFLTDWIDHQLETADLRGLDEPGVPLVRRLNRAEFRNTLRDLTGVAIDVTRLLPADGMSEDGLPNNGNSLFLSSSDLEKLVSASQFVLSHAEVSPTRGFVFHEEPPQPIRHSERVHRAAVELGEYYDAVVRQHLEVRGNALPRYFVAAWEAKSLGDVKDDAQWSEAARRHGVDAEVLQRLSRFLGLDYKNFHADGKGVDFEEFRAHFDALFEPFQNLPPGGDPEEAVRLRPQVEQAAKRFQTVLDAFREDVDYTYSLPGGDHSHPFEMDISGQSMIYLLVTDGGDESDSDYAAWLDGAFRFPDGSVRSLAESDPVEAISGDGRLARGINSRGGPLHIFTQASYLRTVRNRLYEEPSRMNLENPLYRENTIPWDHALAVRAPSLLAFEVPDGAAMFTVRGVMQDISRTHPDQERRKWFDDGMVQFQVSTTRPESLDFIPGSRLTFSNRTQFRQFRRYLEDFVSDYFPSADRWVQIATEKPGQPPERGVFHLHPAIVAEMLLSGEAEAKSELLRRWDEYLLVSAEPRYVREMTEQALNWERRMIAKDHAERVLTLQDVRELAGDEAKAQVAFLDQLLVEGESRLRQAYEFQLKALATKAFRRPLRSDESRRLLDLYDKYIQDDKAYSYDAARFVAESVLVSPQFLYVSEREREGGAVREVDPFELASRLSYFLWSTMPDEELRRLAAEGQLGEVSSLREQTERMLRDRRAVALADQFAGNWLEFRDIREHQETNQELFPAYTESLREAMYQEALLFMQEVIREDRSILELIDCDFTYVNEELAAHYGISGIEGPEMRRVELRDVDRGGILGMASVLTLTSHPARTSPVDRGLYILKNLLDSPPPPPPPDASGQLQETEDEAMPVSFRDQLEAHRQAPSCAACHRRLDPLGFALENFDAIGRFRVTDERTGQAVDTRAELPNGTAVGSLRDVKQALLSGREKKKFIRTFCRRLLAYALARSLTFQDLGILRTMETNLKTNGYRFSAAVQSIVESRQFRYRQVAPTARVESTSTQVVQGRTER